MFSYCGNSPTSRIELGGFFWREIGELGKKTVEVALVIGGIGAMIALVVGIAGFTIGTGGAGGLAIAAAIPIASALLESSALATAAGIVMAAAGNASSSNRHQSGRSGSKSDGNTSKNFQSARSNRDANEWAWQAGEDSAEALKEIYVGKNNGSKFNMLKNKDTGQIVLQEIRTGKLVYTDYYLW